VGNFYFSVISLRHRPNSEQKAKFIKKTRNNHDVFSDFGMIRTVTVCYCYCHMLLILLVFRSLLFVYRYFLRRIKIFISHTELNWLDPVHCK